MNAIIVGMFDTAGQAQAARTQLLAAGFASDDVSTAAGSAGSGQGVARDTDGETRAEPRQEGAIARFFDNLFGNDDDAETNRHADTYQEAFDRGSHGVSVTTASDDEAERAEMILNDAGAIDIDERSEEWRKTGWTGAAAATDTAGAGTQKLQEVQEELKVGKRSVARGGVRVFTRMTETPVEETVTLREEHADIQRRVVDRPATAADLAGLADGSIEIRESAEEAVVSKSARVTGEVDVGKTSTERDEVVRDTVRSSKVEVERLAAEATPVLHDPKKAL